jgi:lysozyme
MVMENYMADGHTEGIDVSSNQGQVDWAAVKNDGKVFAFVRASLGGHQPDTIFSVNWPRMRDAGIIRGAYHFFWPATPWLEQAESFLKLLGSLSPGDLPPALDLEEAIAKGDPAKHDIWQDVPASQRLPMVQNWLDTVEDATGLRPIIYTRQNFIEPLLGQNLGSLGTYPLWIAHYGVFQPRIPPAWTSWTFWQYSDIGAVGGVHTAVDCNRFCGSQDDLKNLAKN